MFYMKKLLMSVLALTMAVSPMTLTTKAAESSVENNEKNPSENTDESLNQGENNDSDPYSYSITGYNKKYDDLLNSRDYYDKNEDKFTVEYDGTTYEFYTDYLTGKYSLRPVGKSWDEIDEHVRISPVNFSYDPNDIYTSPYEYNKNNIDLEKSKCELEKNHNFYPLRVNINNIDELKNNNNMAIYNWDDDRNLENRTLFSYDIDKATEEKIDRTVLLTFLIELDEGSYPCYNRELTNEEIKEVVNWEDESNYRHEERNHLISSDCRYSELKDIELYYDEDYGYNQYRGDSISIDKLTPKYQAKAKEFYNDLVEAYNNVDITEEEIIELLAKYLGEDNYDELSQFMLYTQEDLFGENGYPKVFNQMFDMDTSIPAKYREHVYELIPAISEYWYTKNVYCRDDGTYDTMTNQSNPINECLDYFYLGQSEEGNLTSTDNRWFGDALTTTTAGLKHQLKLSMCNLLNWTLTGAPWTRDKKTTISLYYSENLEDKSQYDLLKTFDVDYNDYEKLGYNTDLFFEWSQDVGKGEEYLILTYDVYYNDVDENGNQIVTTFTAVKDLQVERVGEILNDVNKTFNDMSVGKFWSDEFEKYTAIWTQESIDKAKSLKPDYQLNTTENMVKYVEEKYNTLEYDKEFMTYNRFKDLLVDGNYYFTDIDGVKVNRYPTDKYGWDSTDGDNSSGMWAKPGLLPHQFEKIKYEVDRVDYKDIYTGEYSHSNFKYLFRCEEYGIDQAMTLNYILDNEQAFTPESFAPLKEAMDKVNSVKNSLAAGVGADGLSSTEDVKIMGDIFKAVQKAYLQLEFVHIADPNYYGGDETSKPENGFKAVYEETKEKFESINQALYTSESWDKLVAVLDEATTLYNQVYKGTKILTDQDYMDKVTDDLRLAVNNLEINTDNDKETTIKLLLDSVTTVVNDKDLYTSATWNPIAEELINMQNDLTNNQDEITLETLSAYNIRFVEIRRSLILKYHHAELKELVNKYDSIANDIYDNEHNSKQYTYSYCSFAKFKTAYLETRNKFDNVDDINQAEAEQYYQDLSSSVELLFDLRYISKDGSYYGIDEVDALQEQYYELVASNKYTEESLDVLKKVVFSDVITRNRTRYEGVINNYIRDVDYYKGQVETVIDYYLVLKNPESNPDGGNTEKPSTSIKNPFKDLKSTDWYYNIVLEAYSKGIMLGTSEGKFSPNGTMARGMVATVMYRLAGTPSVKYEAKFKDVKDGVWYSKAITYCYQNQIISGYNNGKFGPDDDITRQDLAVILYNYALKHGYNMKDKADLTKYSDAKQVSSYAKTAVSWAVANGIMGGGKTLNPTGKATRAECAKMFVIFDNLK